MNREKYGKERHSPLAEKGMVMTDAHRTALRFHWSVPSSAGGKGMRGATARAGTSAMPDLAMHREFCQRAEKSGMDSVLVPIGSFRADPVTMAAVMGTRTTTLTCMLASRSASVPPTYFVRQVNTPSLLTGGRVPINSVAGHPPEEQRYFGDRPPHEERYRRTEEFWAICRAPWNAAKPADFDGDYYRLRGASVGVPFGSDVPGRQGGRAPGIYLGGSSSEARRVAIAQADRHVRFVGAPERLAPEIAESLSAGIESGLVLSLIIRPTRQEAVRAAHDLIERPADRPRTCNASYGCALTRSFTHLPRHGGTRADQLAHPPSVEWRGALSRSDGDGSGRLARGHRRRAVRVPARRCQPVRLPGTA